MHSARNPTTHEHAHTPQAGQEQPAQTLTAVILAGRIRRASLESVLNLHVLCLPVGRQGTLLDAWLAKLSEVPNLSEIRVVVNTQEDAAAVLGVLPREYRRADCALRVDVQAEPTSWRGASSNPRRTPTLT